MQDPTGPDTTPTLALDPESLHRAADRLRAIGQEYDATGGSAPAGDFGEAADLVAFARSAHADAAAHLVAEARLLSFAVARAADDVTATDAQQALDLIRSAAR